jgi:hypothetical protein
MTGFIWLEGCAVDQFYALRPRGEELSNVILRMAKIEASRPAGSGRGGSRHRRLATEIPQLTGNSFRLPRWIY